MTRSWFFFIPFLLLPIMAALLFPTLVADSFALLAGSGENTKDTLVHFAHNAYLAWSFDPALLSLAQLLASFFHASAAAVLFASHVFLFTLGVICSLAALHRSIRSAALIGTSTSLLLTLLWGADSIIWGTLLWAPWLVWALLRYQERKQEGWSYLFLTLFFAYRTVLSAGPWTLLVVLSAALIVLSQQQSPASHFRRFLWPGITLTVAALVGFFQGKEAPFPAYPHLARVVPDDGLSGIVRPLMGPDYPLPVIDLPALKTLFFPLGVALFVLTFGLLLAKIALHRRVSTSHKVLLGASLFILADVVAPESIRVILPLATIERVFPYWNFYPFLSIALAFLIPLLSILVLLEKNIHLRVSGSIVVVLTLFFLAHSYEKTHSPYLVPQLQSELQDAFFHEQEQKLLLSPSFRIIRQEGLELITQREEERPPLRPGRRFVETIESPQSTQLKKILYGKNTKRWSMGKGKQTGDEWLKVTFQEPISLFGMSLSPGPYTSDFPRGLRVSSKEQNCTQAFTSEAEVLFEERHWQGGLQFTEGGFPYYGAQFDVRLDFLAPTRSRCLLIEQIGTSDHFDWSIMNLKIAALPLESR